MSTVLTAVEYKKPRLYLAHSARNWIRSYQLLLLVDRYSSTNQQVDIFMYRVVSLAAAVVFLFLIEWWVVPCFVCVDTNSKVAFVGTEHFNRRLLMFAGTNVWKSPERYLGFLLPNEQIKISVPHFAESF